MVWGAAATAANRKGPENNCSQGEANGKPGRGEHAMADGAVDAVRFESGVEGAGEDGEKYCGGKGGA